GAGQSQRSSDKGTELSRAAGDCVGSSKSDESIPNNSSACIGGSTDHSPAGSTPQHHSNCECSARTETGASETGIDSGSKGPRGPGTLAGRACARENRASQQRSCAAIAVTGTAGDTAA